MTSQKEFLQKENEKYKNQELQLQEIKNSVNQILITQKKSNFITNFSQIPNILQELS